MTDRAEGSDNSRPENPAGNVALPLAAEPWRPKVNPWIIAVVVAMAAFMEVLDTSIANVALPYMAGKGRRSRQRLGPHRTPQPGRLQRRDLDQLAQRSAPVSILIARCAIEEQLFGLFS